MSQRPPDKNILIIPTVDRKSWQRGPGNSARWPVVPLHEESRHLSIAISYLPFDRPTLPWVLFACLAIFDKSIASVSRGLRRHSEDIEAGCFVVCITVWAGLWFGIQPQTRSPVLVFRSIARNQWVSTAGISFVSLHRNKRLGRRTRNPELSAAAESWLAELWEGTYY